jgi:hypothetical protein
MRIFKIANEFEDQGFDQSEVPNLSGIFDNIYGEK